MTSKAKLRKLIKIRNALLGVAAVLLAAAIVSAVLYYMDSRPASDVTAETTEATEEATEAATQEATEAAAQETEEKPSEETTVAPSEEVKRETTAPAETAQPADEGDSNTQPSFPGGGKTDGSDSPVPTSDVPVDEPVTEPETKPEAETEPETETKPDKSPM